MLLRGSLVAALASAAARRRRYGLVKSKENVHCAVDVFKNGRAPR
jgi:hypothetical protein